MFELSGIVLCLVFNVIAVIVCWIKGGGELFFNYRMQFVIGMLVLKSWWQVSKSFFSPRSMRCLDVQFHICYGTGLSTEQWGDTLAYIWLFPRLDHIGTVPITELFSYHLAGLTALWSSVGFSSSTWWVYWKELSSLDWIHFSSSLYAGVLSIFCITDIFLLTDSHWVLHICRHCSSDHFPWTIIYVSLNHCSSNSS